LSDTAWWDRHLACLRRTGRMPGPTESFSVSDKTFGR
jgi:hypothetical protein